MAETARAELLSAYIAAGLALVPIPTGQKGPKGTRAKGWNLRENAITTIEQALAKITGNVGLAHAYCSPTPTCAIDIDNIEQARPWLAARGVDIDAHLAAPDAVRIDSGRPGRAKLLYRTPTALPTRKIDGLELRCASNNGNTEQDVLPPSIHPDTGLPYRLIGDISHIPPIPDDILRVWTELGATLRSNKLTAVKTDDTLLQAMQELGMVRADAGGGKFHIECPFADQHTAFTGDGETAYFLAHTNGYELSHFKCLHAHCEKRSDNEFAAAILARYNTELQRPAPFAIGGPSVIPHAQHLTTDQANADRLLKEAGHAVMFSAGRWYIWSGTHWSADKAAAYRETCRLSKIIRAEAEAWIAKTTDSVDEAEHNKEIAESLQKWARASEMKNRLDAAFYLLQQLVTKSAAVLDRDPYLLTVSNGTIDLRTGKLRPHDKADLITRIIDIEYDSDATAPRFAQALAEITGEATMEKKPLADFLQRWFGYCATGLTSEQALAVHHGDGANGKSLVLGSIERILGPYAGSAAPGLMVGKSDRHPTEIADLHGKRMVTAYETAEDGVLREDFIKRMTGSDTIKARYMRQDFFEFSPTHKLQLVTNHKPQIRGQDFAIWRRVLLVPYLVTFGSGEAVRSGEAHHLRDDALPERLKEEDAGILAWIVQGARRWHMVGLNPPDAVIAAGRAYREEQDRVGEFIKECCERDANAWTPLTGLGGLYTRYSMWCRDSGYQPLGRKRFQDALEKRPGVSQVKRTQGSGYLGLRLY